MITKSKLISTLDSLPENFSIDQLIDHLIFVEKVQRGLEDSEKGRVHSKEEGHNMLFKWFK